LLDVHRLAYGDKVGRPGHHAISIRAEGEATNPASKLDKEQFSVKGHGRSLVEEKIGRHHDRGEIVNRVDVVGIGVGAGVQGPSIVAALDDSIQLIIL